MNNRIKELRDAAGLTLQELAEDAGTTHQQIFRLENGERRLTHTWMVRIGKAPGVPPAALITPDFKAASDAIKDAKELRWLQIWRRMDDGDRSAALVFLDRMTARGDTPAAPPEHERPVNQQAARGPRRRDGGGRLGN